MTILVKTHRDYIELVNAITNSTIETFDHGEYSLAIKLKTKLENAEDNFKCSYLYAPYRYIYSGGKRIKVPTKEYIRRHDELTKEQLNQLEDRYLIKDVCILKGGY